MEKSKATLKKKSHTNWKSILVCMFNGVKSNDHNCMLKWNGRETKISRTYKPCRASMRVEMKIMRYGQHTKQLTINGLNTIFENCKPRFRERKKINQQQQQCDCLFCLFTRVFSHSHYTQFEIPRHVNFEHTNSHTHQIETTTTRKRYLFGSHTRDEI